METRKRGGPLLRTKSIKGARENGHPPPSGIERFLSRIVSRHFLPTSNNNHFAPDSALFLQGSVFAKTFPEQNNERTFANRPCSRTAPRDQLTARTNTNEHKRTRTNRGLFANTHTNPTITSRLGARMLVCVCVLACQISIIDCCLSSRALSPSCGGWYPSF